MKKVVIQCLAASVCVLFLASCGGGGSVGTKAAKELCDCIKEVEKKSSGKNDLASGFEALGCLMTIGEKYKEHLGGGDKQSAFNFKDTKVEKDFETALAKCSPEYAKRLKDK